MLSTSIQAVEVSRAPKWAPRKGVPKGETAEEEEEEDEEEEEEEGGGGDDDDDHDDDDGDGDDDEEDKEEERSGRKGGGVDNAILSLTFCLGHRSPHPPVCRQSSSSLGLPLGCYHRGYSSATNVRSCFPSMVQ